MVFRTSIALILFAWVLLPSAFSQDNPEEKKEEGTVESEEANKDEEEKEQEAPLPPAPPVVIVRRTVDNFLTDPKARAPFALGENGVRPMISTFTLDSPDGRYRVVWDPTACRLVGILDLKPAAASIAPSGEESTPPSPFLIVASGVPPLSSAPGASDEPSYFGFRLVGGHPEFLYEQGQLAIEERIWFDKDPGVLYQLFRVKKLSGPLSIRFPAEWKKFVTAEGAEWQEEILTFPSSDKHRHVIKYDFNAGQTPENP